MDDIHVPLKQFIFNQYLQQKKARLSNSHAVMDMIIKRKEQMIKKPINTTNKKAHHLILDSNRSVELNSKLEHEVLVVTFLRVNNCHGILLPFKGSL